MASPLLLLPVVLPILFWGGYHYHKDRHLPEPLAHLALAFGLGMLAAGISQALYVSLGWFGLRYDAGVLADTSAAALFAYAVFAIGPIEELAKLLPFVAIIIRFEEFDEPLDGFIYASFIALGYAAVENWQYLEYLTPVEAAARGFASPVVHIVFASIWAYWITRAYLSRRWLTGHVIVGFVVSAGLHGLYDFLVMLQPVSALPVAAALVVAIWFWRLRLMREMERRPAQTR